MRSSADRRGMRLSLPEEPRPSSSSARFSACGAYRWWLLRQWAPGRPRLLFIGLNPSSADARREDPTLRRLVGFADRWGFGSLEVVNLFSAVAVAPDRLRQLADPVGRRTDAWIARRAGACAVQAIWLGWGRRGGFRQRDQRILALLNRLGRGEDLRVVGLTATGQPRHPLYVRADRPWQPWAPAAS
ncbi:MAG: DUF1643 domain-containing protein [Synechococcaceae cyanobacterium]|nr:DUF1643 domain-containing protein [Synechococcaceae cyanobacterium]